MNKIIKMFCLVIVFIVSLVIILNKDVITAFAKNLIIEDVEYGQVYEYGEKIGIFDDWGDSIQNIWAGYLDKDGELLSFSLKGGHIYTNYFINNGYHPAGDYGYTYMNYFNLGYTCNETVEEFFDFKYMNGNLSEPEYYESYLSFLADFKRSVCGVQAWNFNYLEYENELKTISKWKVVNNEGKKLDYYCDLYDFDVRDCDNQYSLSYPVMMFQEYVEPKFELICDSDKVEYGKCLNCNLNIDSEEKITKLKTNINSKDLELDKISANSGWKYEVDDDGFYILKNEEGFTGKEDVVELQFVAKKNIDSTTMINLDNFEYTTSGGYTEKVNLNVNVKIDSNTKNPNTVDKRIYFINSLLVIACCILGIAYKNKNTAVFEQ